MRVGNHAHSPLPSRSILPQTPLPSLSQEATSFPTYPPIFPSLPLHHPPITPFPPPSPPLPTTLLTTLPPPPPPPPPQQQPPLASSHNPTRSEATSNQSGGVYSWWEDYVLCGNGARESLVTYNGSLISWIHDHCGHHRL